MDLAWLAIKVIVLTVVCSAGPGLWVVGRFGRRFSPMEKLCGVFSASFICVYLVSFALFLSNAPAWAYAVTTAVYLGMGLSGWRTARLLLRRRRSRNALWAGAAVLAWDLLHLAMVRHYGGGGWAGDWREHYQRTQYFLHQLSDDYLFIGLHRLPARPPMMNLVAAFFCRQTGMSFEAFSLVFVFLNAWAFFPCALFLSLARRRGGRSLWVLALLFMLNPSIVENATLTVTKELAAGLVILGVCFYLRRRTPAAGMCLAAAVLVHYSAAPFAVAVSIHWLFTLLRGRRFSAQPVLTALSSAALLATWFVWSFAEFGRRLTFSAGISTTGLPRWSIGENLRRMLFNLFTSVVPHALHPVYDKSYTLLGDWGQINDYYFTMTQETFPMMAGLTGGIVGVWLAGRLLFSRGRLSAPYRGFWVFYLPLTFIIGICVNNDWDDYGCAHITLQSLSMMTVALLAAWLADLPRGVIRIVAAGAAVDYGLGILLQFDRQSYVYPMVNDAAGRLIMLPDYTLGRMGAGEYAAKLRAGYVFWGDHLAAAGAYLEIASVAIACGAIWYLFRVRAKR